MRVLLVTTSYPRDPADPAGRFIAQAAEALAEVGAAVTVLAPHAAGLAENETRAGVRLIRFRYAPIVEWQRVAYGSGIPDNLLTSWRARLGLPGFLWSLRRAVLRLAPEVDLVHAHWLPVGWLAAAGADRAGKPLCVSLRGSDLAGAWLPGRLMTSLAARGAWFIANGPALIRRAQELAAPSDRLLELPNGFPLEAYAQLPGRAAARARLGWSPDQLYILTVGRLAAVKNQAELLAGFAPVSNGFPAARLVLVGEGEEQARLERQVAELGLSSRVEFAGRLPPEAIPDYLAAADIFVLPSHREGRPNALLEALAAGCPVVAAAAPGVAEVFAAGQGLSYPPGDVQALAAALRELLADPARRQALGTNARERFLAENISWSEHAQRLMHIYRQALNRAH